MSNDNFKVKDSGSREKFESGMVRDTAKDKVNFALALDGPMFKRLAVHLTKGAQKYAERNWMQASGEAELKRFRESALRHFLQWWDGDQDEDHAAAVLFNINGAEFVKDKITAEKEEAKVFVQGLQVEAEKRKARRAVVNQFFNTPVPYSADELNAVCGCRIAAPGWYCSREVGHEGPCAALRIPKLCPECHCGRLVCACDICTPPPTHADINA